MPKGYRHLTQEQRYTIQNLKERKFSQKNIAAIIKVSPSALSRELKRNRSEDGYKYVVAQKQSIERRQDAVKRRIRKVSGDTRLYVNRWLTESQWSPEIISAKLEMEVGVKVSHETLYQYIWRDKDRGGTLYKYLRRRGKKYMKRGSSTAGRGCIPGRVDIKERPSIVDAKERIGDWEADLIVGGQGDTSCILSVVERKSKLTLLGLIPCKEAEVTADAVITLLKPYSRFVHTVTTDNGKEFAAHRRISESLAAHFYFATPYHSWERGLNENTNGLIRQYFPKGKSFANLTHEDVAHVQALLNARPRKTLKFSTPLEAFFSHP